MKLCLCCGDTKDRSEFYRNKAMKDELTRLCKNCHNAAVTRYRSKAPDKAKESQRKWQSENAEKCRASNKRSYRKNTSKFLARNAKRRAAQLMATPQWANEALIASYYAVARWLNLTIPGQTYHVDHVVPLVNNLVCGLHVEHNLSILRAEDNLRKSNKFNIEKL